MIYLIGAPEDRLALGKRMGADEVFDIEDGDSEARVGFVRERTAGRGAEVVIEASGSPAAVKEGLLMARDAGRYVVVGQYTDNGEVTINPHLDVNRKHLDVRGC